MGVPLGKNPGPEWGGGCLWFWRWVPLAPTPVPTLYQKATLASTLATFFEVLSNILIKMIE